MDLPSIRTRTGAMAKSLVRQQGLDAPTQWPPGPQQEAARPLRAFQR